MNKLYVVVRKDLPKIYAAVQGGHAIAQWVNDYQPIYDDWKNGYLIFVTADNEISLKEIAEDCVANNYKIAIFHEPDLNNQITAFACLSSDKDRTFKKLQLL